MSLCGISSVNGHSFDLLTYLMTKCQAGLMYLKSPYCNLNQMADLLSDKGVKYCQGFFVQCFVKTIPLQIAF